MHVLFIPNNATEHFHQFHMASCGSSHVFFDFQLSPVGLSAVWPSAQHMGALHNSFSTSKGLDAQSKLDKYIDRYLMFYAKSTMKVIPGQSQIKTRTQSDAKLAAEVPCERPRWTKCCKYVHAARTSVLFLTEHSSRIKNRLHGHLLI